MTRTAITTSQPALGPYSDAVRAGDFLFLSGRIGLVDDRLAFTTGEQVRDAIVNCADILTAAGASLDNVVRCTLYLTDLRDFEEANRAYAELFGSPPPARTTIGVAALPRGAKAEIEMTALWSDDRHTDVA